MERHYIDGVLILPQLSSVLLFDLSAVAEVEGRHVVFQVTQ